MCADMTACTYKKVNANLNNFFFNKEIGNVALTFLNLVFSCNTKLPCQCSSGTTPLWMVSIAS